MPVYSDFLFFFLLLGLLFPALLIVGLRNIETAQKRAAYAQALLTMAALVVSAYWYLFERQPSVANISQQVSVAPLGDDVVAIEAHIAVENLGARLLRIDRISSRLQLVSVEPYSYGDLSEKTGDEYWLSNRPDSVGRNFNEAELRWPVFRKYDGISIV